MGKMHSSFGGVPHVPGVVIPLAVAFYQCSVITLLEHIDRPPKVIRRNRSVQKFFIKRMSQVEVNLREELPIFGRLARKRNPLHLVVYAIDEPLAILVLDSKRQRDWSAVLLKKSESRQSEHWLGSCVCLCVVCGSIPLRQSQGEPVPGDWHWRSVRNAGGVGQLIVKQRTRQLVTRRIS